MHAHLPPGCLIGGQEVPGEHIRGAVGDLARSRLACAHGLAMGKLSWGLIVAACGALATAAPVLSAALGQPTLRTENVVLVTVDGLRHQELFTGLDPALVDGGLKSGVEDPRALAARFSDDTPRGRRERLMPFFWKTLAPRGIVLGSRADGATVEVTNPYRVSYPSYAEILTGQVLAEVTGNIPIQVPRETVLEFVRRKLDLQMAGVAAFTSWNHFPYIVEHETGTITVNAGGPFPQGTGNDQIRRLVALEGRTLSPWASVRQNAFTEGLALAYLEDFKPRFMYLALDETDEWAHARRYDRTVEAIRHFDETLRLLWELLQSMETYRDKTTLVITTDHGRGRTPDDWTSHGPDIPGAEEIWIAIVGPDTAARGIVPDHAPLRQTQIAATILRFFGLDSAEFNPQADESIALAFP